MKKSHSYVVVVDEASGAIWPVYRISDDQLNRRQEKNLIRSAEPHGYRVA